MKHKTLTKAASIFALSMVGLAAATAANAGPLVAPKDKGGSESRTYQSKECETALRSVKVPNAATPASDVCRITVPTSYSDAKSITLADIQTAKSGLSVTEFASLAQAVTAGTVKSRYYSQQMNHITDSETQSGTFYYDGVRAWVTSSYRGFSGSHRCMIDWAVGFGVSPQNCYESGSTSERVLYQQWLMTPFLHGFPVSWSETYTLRVNAAGQVW
ncbi:MAG: hypothetical protein RJA66_545 [Actinomycetota bacterium]|jgi:hypothetical protein